MKIQKIDFETQQAYEIGTKSSKMIVITSFGPRIAFFGKEGGRNLLFWEGKENKLRRGDWILRGGHRVWTTRPGADECEETYATDNLPCSVRKGNKGIHVSAPPDAAHGTQKSMIIQVLGDNTFSVENRVTNIGPMLWSGGVWGLTCTAPKGKCMYGIPIGDGSEWDMYRSVCFKKWAGGQTGRFNDNQIGFTEKCLTISPKGVQAKRMIETHAGIIGMSDPEQGLSFIKHAAYQPHEQYPLGTNSAFYIAPKNAFVEMELMSPMVTLKPGGSISLREIWMLKPEVNWKDPDLNISELSKW